MSFTRPNPPQRPSSSPKPNPVSQASKPQRKVIPDPVRGGGNHGGGGGGNRGGNGGNNNHEPSPWLDHPSHTLANPSPEASFVEYLRWMREVNRKPDKRSGKDPTDPATKTQILQLAEESANYTERLNKLTERTKKIAGTNNYFWVQCPWRIRVGGHRGPESILLPAFDALGMPFIPSSTLRGVARAEALRQLGDKKKVNEYFGDLDAKDGDRMGKVVFLDAYPLPSRTDKSGGLTVDMANNIWKWDDDNLKPYKPNPNPFFSLQGTSFLIGIRPLTPKYSEITEQVNKWLIAGLSKGLGSQVNSGYGVLETEQPNQVDTKFLEIEFDVTGQKIHGVHYFQNASQPFKEKDGNLKPDTFSNSEVRSTAFKSMLRYWFRVFARGVLPPKRVREIENQIFGGIEPNPTWGYLCVRVEEIDPPTDIRNTQSGILRLYTSNALPQEHGAVLKNLCKSLTWLMFRLGGVGQGARRPCYERRGNPKIRGCNLTPYSEDNYWHLPEIPKRFTQLFQDNLKLFYNSLEELSGSQINIRNFQNIGQPTRERWFEVADSHCKIFVFRGEEVRNKNHGLAILHDHKFKPDPNNPMKYDRFLCGSTDLPSPVWIANAEKMDYQIITVFGATQDPRKRFVNELRQLGAIQIFPIA